MARNIKNANNKSTSLTKSFSLRGLICEAVLFGTVLSVLNLQFWALGLGFTCSGFGCR